MVCTLSRLFPLSALALLSLASLAIPVTATTSLPGESGCSTHTSPNPRPDSWYNAELGVPDTVYDDSCFHQFMVNSPDTPTIDVAIVPPPGAFGLRDANLLKQSVQMWEDGIQHGARGAGMGWLADGFQLNPYVVGVDVPIGASEVMPDIVILVGDASPYLFGYAFAGVGSDAPITTCHPLTASTTAADFPSADQVRRMPGFDGHHGGPWGTLDASCPNGERVCTVVGAVLQDGLSAAHTNNLYDLTSHEFGHCLGLGHVGDASDVPASLDYPPDDIMSYETDGHDPSYALCVSNLDLKTIAYRYQPLIPGAPALRYGADASGHIVMQGGANPSAPTNQALANPLPASSWRIIRADGSLGTSAADCPQPDTSLLPLPGSGGSPDPDPATEPVLAITSPADGAALGSGTFAVEGTVQHQATTTTSLGTEIVTDPAGDTQAGCDSSNPTAPSPCINAPNGSHDLVRVGGANDAGRLSFYLTVADLSQFDANQPFHVEASFAHTAVAEGTGLYYSIKAAVTDAATATPVGLYASGSVLGASAGPRLDTADVQARILAPDTIELSVDLASIGNPVAGQALTEVQATVTTPDTLDYFTVDDTAAGTYVMGSAAAGAPQAPLLPVSVAGARLASNGCAGTLPTPDFLFATPSCSLAVPAGTASVELHYNTTFDGLFSAWVQLFDPAGTVRADSLQDCPRPPSGVGVTASCTMVADAPVQAGTWTAEIYYQAGEVDESYSLELVARGPDTVALAVDANGPYAGLVGSPIAIAASVAGGAPPVACSWSGAGASFADAGSCSTAVTFATAGTHTITVTASDAAGGSASDSATVQADAGTGNGERVELYDGSSLVGSAAVSPTGTAPETWSILASGLSGGQHTLTALWFADGASSQDTPLAMDAVTVDVAGTDPCAGASAPALSGIAWSADGSSATITWSTDVASTSRVDFGTSASYGSSATAPGETTQHSVTLAGLAADTTYHYAVASAACGLESASADNTFATTGRAPSIAIASPTAGSIVQAPVTFTGSFDVGTQGQSSQGLGVATASTGTPSWASTLQGILASPSWQQLVAKLSEKKGFLGAVPDLHGGATVSFSGKLPALPATLDGFELHAVQAKPTILSERVDPDEAAFLDRLSVADAVADWGAKAAAEPSGPAAPGLPDGIGPGTAMLMGVDGITNLCSLSYLLQDPTDSSQYYAATAGHCLLATGQGVDRTGEANPSQVFNHFELCYAACIDNALQFGSYVVLTPDDGYEPVAYASAAPVGAADADGIGRDFGLLRIPKELNVMLRPWLPEFGGPDDEADAFLGDLVVHYGHGSYCCPVTGSFASRTPLDQGRVAVALGSFDDGSFEAIGSITGGDSGSASGIGWIDGEKGVRGTDALGVNTHGIDPGTGIFDGTLLSKGQAMVQRFLGFTPALVASGDAIDLGTGTGPATGIAFTAPDDGATLQGPAPVAIAGTATFPADGPGTGGSTTATYFLHRTSCGQATDHVYMDTDAGTAPDAGDGCGSLVAPVGLALKAIAGAGVPTLVDPGLDNAYAAEPAPPQLRFDVSRPVHVDVAVTAREGTPVVLGAYEASLEADGVTVATGSTSAVVADGRAAFDLAWTDAAGSVPAGGDLVFHFDVVEGATGVYIGYGGPAGSFVDIPTAPSSVRSVEVSVDDAGFGAASLLASTGTTSWGATWDLSGVAAGAHTLHARTLVDGVPTGDAATRAVTVAVDTAEHGLRTQLRLEGPDGVVFDWTTVGQHDGQATGSWASTWDGPAAAGDYHVFARLMDDADELAASDVAFAIDVAPDLSTPATAGATEGQAFSLGLTATDPDSAELTYTVAGLPAGATLDGDQVRWTPGYDAAGSYPLEVTVSDGRLEDHASLTLVVGDVNRAPDMVDVPDQVVVARSTLTFTVPASDPDGDALALTATGLPDGATFDAATGTFSWTPTHRQAGAESTAYTVRFDASDGQASVGQDVAITVTHH